MNIGKDMRVSGFMKFRNRAGTLVSIFCQKFFHEDVREAISANQANQSEIPFKI